MTHADLLEQLRIVKYGALERDRNDAIGSIGAAFGSLTAAVADMSERLRVSKDWKTQYEKSQKANVTLRKNNSAS